ncbi:MAG: hypothetical protein J4203_01015 [Candidatus Diapherotrites archaeon]|uniref:DNA-binding protein n=1 Tax=Candidatus Iainarchaeum sp. TaxID=3101447 RepID=A0A8T4L711_9ARCH|nr:hypothetical protein [Candidatus Diapherotrites archaeon]
MLVKELKPNTPIPEMELEITTVGEPRRFATERGEGTVANAAGKDSEGQEVSVSLWGDDTGLVKEGNKIRITEGWCTAYKGKIQVSAGKRGKLAVL